MYLVKFTGDYFILYTTVIANSEEEAIDEAMLNIKDHYGWELNAVANEITVELEGTFN